MPYYILCLLKLFINVLNGHNIIFKSLEFVHHLRSVNDQCTIFDKNYSFLSVSVKRVIFLKIFMWIKYIWATSFWVIILFLLRLIVHENKFGILYGLLGYDDLKTIIINNEI